MATTLRGERSAEGKRCHHSYDTATSGGALANRRRALILVLDATLACLVDEAVVSTAAVTAFEVGVGQFVEVLAARRHMIGCPLWLTSGAQLSFHPNRWATSTTRATSVGCRRPHSM